MTNGTDKSTGTVTSRDGTTIGYRKSGSGPGLILLHGAMQTSRSFSKLSNLLSGHFTVFAIDRRGRGLSGPHGNDYSMCKEVEDVGAVLDAVGAHNVFGLSSGALVALRATFLLPAIKRAALYEPPLKVSDDFSPLIWVKRYDEAMARGDLAAAMVSINKGAGDQTLETRMPRFVMAPLMRIMIRADAKNAGPDYTPLRDLIPTVRFDIQLAREMAGTLEDYRNLKAEVLLLGGEKSASFLKPSLDALARVIPLAKCTEFSGIGHLAADDIGDPARVAEALRIFFS